MILYVLTLFNCCVSDVLVKSCPAVNCLNHISRFSAYLAGVAGRRNKQRVESELHSVNRVEDATEVRFHEFFFA